MDEGAPRIVSSLRIGAGTMSCDVVVCMDGGFRRYYLATSSARDIVLKISQNMARDMECDQPEPAGRVYDIIRWANLSFKDKCIRDSCRIVGPNGAPVVVDTMTRVLTESLHDYDSMHPSGLMGYGHDRLTSKCTISEVQTGGGSILRLEPCTPTETSVPLPFPNCGIMSFRIPDTATSGGTKELEVPYPITPGGETINSTVFMVGDRFRNCFKSYCKEIETDRSPPEEAVIEGSNRCSVALFHPRTMKICGGLFSAIGDDPSSRRHVGISGMEFVDDTAQRISIVCEHEGGSILMVCGCMVRNSVMFPRAHVPVVLGGRVNQIKMAVLTDIPNGGGALLTFTRSSGEVRKCVIDTQRRTSFNQIMWVEMLEQK